MMKLDEFRAEVAQHNLDHPELPNCIYPNCPNKIYPLWDNKVLCEEHNLLVEFWFYEEDGYSYCPDIWDFDTGKKLPKPEGSDENMATYRKRYCDWIASLSPETYLAILKHQIGDDE
jgi:hypothetical protein